MGMSMGVKVCVLKTRCVVYFLVAFVFAAGLRWYFPYVKTAFYFILFLESKFIVRWGRALCRTTTVWTVLKCKLSNAILCRCRLASSCRVWFSNCVIYSRCANVKMNNGTGHVEEREREVMYNVSLFPFGLCTARSIWTAFIVALAV